jgi:hypothetical protein
MAYAACGVDTEVNMHTHTSAQLHTTNTITIIMMRATTTTTMTNATTTTVKTTTTLVPPPQCAYLAIHYKRVRLVGNTLITSCFTSVHRDMAAYTWPETMPNSFGNDV